MNSIIYVHNSATDEFEVAQAITTKGACGWTHFTINIESLVAYRVRRKDCTTYSHKKSNCVQRKHTRSDFGGG